MQSSVTSWQNIMMFSWLFAGSEQWTLRLRCYATRRNPHQDGEWFDNAESSPSIHLHRLSEGRYSLFCPSQGILACSCRWFQFNAQSLGLSFFLSSTEVEARRFNSVVDGILASLFSFSNSLNEWIAESDKGTRTAGVSGGKPRSGWSGINSFMIAASICLY